MHYEAQILFEDTGEIYEALRVEAGREIPRTRVEIKHRENEVELRIFADDAHALRAALNSYLRWIGLAKDVMEVIKNGGT